MGTLAASKEGYTPYPDGWLPQPLVEDRSQFGMHAITSSPLMLSFNVTNTTLLSMVWDIISNQEAILVSAFVLRVGRRRGSGVARSQVALQRAREEVSSA